MKLLKPLSQNGQAFVQALIAVAILGAVLTASVSMMTSNQKKLRQMSLKMSSLDLDRYLNSVLFDGAVCNYVLTHPVPAPIDPATVAAGHPPTISLASIPVKGMATSPIAIGLTSAAGAVPYAQSLYIKAIDVVDLACLTPPCTGATNQFSANLQISFDLDKLEFPLKPLKFPIIFNTTKDAGGLQDVSGCPLNAGGGGGGSGSGGPGSQSFTGSGTFSFQVPSSFNTLTVKVVGGGAGGVALNGGGHSCGYLSGQPGGTSSFNSVVAQGGQSGSQWYNGIDGGASGGDTNTTGGAGNGGAGANNGVGNYGGNGGSGGVATKTFTPANLTPGSAVNGTVGGGGANTVGGGACGVQASPGGSGRVDIQWQ